MKSIVIYYSLDGSTRLVADKIQQVFHADSLEIHLVREPRPEGWMRLFTIARQVYLKSTPKLAEPIHDLSGYDKIFLGSPVWMGTMAPAIRSFLCEAHLNDKLVVPFCTYDAELGHYFEDLRKTCPVVKFSFGMGFKYPKELEDETLEESVRVWLNNIKT